MSMYGGQRRRSSKYPRYGADIYDDEWSSESDDSIDDHGYPRIRRNSFGDNGWGMRGPRGRAMDDFTPFYDSDSRDSFDDFHDEDFDHIQSYPRPPRHYPHPHHHRHRHHDEPRRTHHQTPSSSSSYNKHSHHHQQHRSSHHQHHHVHHHQYIHNYSQPLTSIPGPPRYTYNYDDSLEASAYGHSHAHPALSYYSPGAGSTSSGMGMGVSGALLPYTHPSRRCGLMRPPRYGYGYGYGGYGCAVHGRGGGGGVPRALGPPLPGQLGTPVPRRY
ncbi:hypothetical protein FQN54_002594 [Arachnomyces sp. PD_36]|nr:hypothetical protein FQN54_002594 [Arachnomyces sp. PD_36]